MRFGTLHNSFYRINSNWIFNNPNGDLLHSSKFFACSTWQSALYDVRNIFKQWMDFTSWINSTIKIKVDVETESVEFASVQHANEISSKTANHFYCSIKNYLSISSWHAWKLRRKCNCGDLIVTIFVSKHIHTHFLSFVVVRCKWQTALNSPDLKTKMIFLISHSNCFTVCPN